MLSQSAYASQSRYPDYCHAEDEGSERDYQMFGQREELSGIVWSSKKGVSIAFVLITDHPDDRR
ncbi:hypothetical protein GGQ17_003179 [Salinibacter ruber]|nr:hypothetical protein [Salinibacter ruber]